MQLGNALSRLLPPSSRTPQAGRHAHRVGANVYVQAMLASHCLQRMSNGGLVGYGQSKRLRGGTHDHVNVSTHDHVCVWARMIMFVWGHA
eukprot:365289-Chlamydomonas_euryale.AAC.10